MLKLKGCRRCGGDVMQYKEDDGSLWWNCLQCAREERSIEIGLIPQVVPQVNTVLKAS